MGFLVLEDLVTVKILSTKNVIVVLCKDKIFIATYKKNVNSIVFFMKTFTELWEQKDIAMYGINFQSKSFDKIFSTNMVVF